MCMRKLVNQAKCERGREMQAEKERARELGRKSARDERKYEAK